MTINTYGFVLLITVLLFCALGCGREHSDTLMPDDAFPPSDAGETADVAKASFEQHLLPILTARCALAGCHVADGPHGLDFRTYESFIAGGEHGPAFIPGNAAESEVVEEIAEGKMPPGGPRLPDNEIQRFVDWINQQAPTADNQRDDHDDHDHDDDHDDDDDDHDDDHDNDDHDD